MKDYTLCSDSDESEAVGELLTQANDLCILEQIAAINCSGVSDSLLPSHLENRFRRLKTLPSSSSSSKPIISNSKPSSRSPPSGEESTTFSGSRLGSGPKSENGSRFDSPDSLRGSVNPSEKKDLDTKSKSNSESRYVSSVLDDPIFSPEKENLGQKREKKPKYARSKSFFSPLSSSDSSLNSSPSPPQKSGCLWCSPKRVSKKKGKGGGRNTCSSLDWDNADKILSSFPSFSAKDQKKMLKKAEKEEERISREAEKIVEWAKHASARMNVSDIEDELSDDDERSFSD